MIRSFRFLSEYKEPSAHVELFDNNNSESFWIPVNVYQYILNHIRNMNSGNIETGDGLFASYYYKVAHYYRYIGINNQAVFEIDIKLFGEINYKTFRLML